jgi:hypothetical protein
VKPGRIDPAFSGALDGLVVVDLRRSAPRLRGFFDEAHMDRDFRALVGATPLATRAAGGSIRPIRSVFGAA